MRPSGRLMLNRDRHTLIVGLGNPKKYENTRHSIGNLALQSLHRLLAEDQLQKQQGWIMRSMPDTKVGLLKKWAKVTVPMSSGEEFTLVQSHSLMNISGSFVQMLYKAWMADMELKPEQMGLILVHDELEAAMGAVRVRKWDSSAKGHNGVRDCQKRLEIGRFPGAVWSRIAVGIDRPESRAPEDVAAYVLAPLESAERKIVDQKVGSEILRLLQSK